MRAASEAVIEALVVVDVEARRLFVVKRAAGLPFPPGADKLDRAPDHARQRHAVAQFVQKGGGDRHPPPLPLKDGARSAEHTSELQSLMRSSYAVFCLTKTKHQ